MNKLFKTKVVDTFDGHQVKLTIDHQSFLLVEQTNEKGWSSEEEANWYKKQLNIALNRLIEKAKL